MLLAKGNDTGETAVSLAKRYHYRAVVRLVEQTAFCPPTPMNNRTRLCPNVVLVVALLLCICTGRASSALENSFSHLWGGYSTSLHLRSQEQRHNSSTAARDLDGTIIPPGGMFSFNQLVGARDTGKGYQAAPMITASGRMLDTPGGGICQLASTIYNAGLLAGMQVVERHPHSRTVGHIPPGRDATISSWRKDLKLKNPHQQPLQLRMSVDKNRITTSFYATREKPFSTEIRVSRTRLLPDTVLLGKGAGTAEQPGGSGFATETVRITTRNGASRTELISRDTYPPPSRIISRETP